MRVQQILAEQQRKVTALDLPSSGRPEQQLLVFAFHRLQQTLYLAG